MKLKTNFVMLKEPLLKKLRSSLTLSCIKSIWMNKTLGDIKQGLSRDEVEKKHCVAQGAIAEKVAKKLDAVLHKINLDEQNTR